MLQVQQHAAHAPLENILLKGPPPVRIALQDILVLQPALVLHSNALLADTL
jgi:hypothetical protein